MRFDKAIYGLLIVLLMGLLLMAALSGCEVLKTKQSKAVDSTSVAKKDSGVVKTNTNDSKDSLAWWRDIVNLRDTIIIQNGQPVTHVYPTSYIREGGTQVKTQREVNYDSLWFNRLDSLSKRSIEDSKSKETKVLTQWWIWLIVGLVGLAALKILLPFKIVQK